MTTIPVFWVSTDQCPQHAHDAALQWDGSPGEPILVEADSWIKPAPDGRFFHVNVRWYDV